MPLTPVEFPNFKGLDLRQDPQLVGGLGAIDAMNVVFDQAGAVRTRNGLTAAYTAPATLTATNPLWPWTSSQLLSLQTTARIYAISTNTATFSSNGSTAMTDTITAACEMRSTSSSLYLAVPGVGCKTLTTAGVYANLGGTSPANPLALTVQTPDQRLVVLEVGGKTWFSDPTAPSTFGTNNWVQLPSDVNWLVSWNDLVFAFSPSQFFVFYGNSTDSAGEPIFNYRLVSDSIGAGIVLNNFVSAAAGPDGVYFFNATGVYRTTGGPPAKISDPLDPIFDQAALPYFTYAAGGTVFLPRRIVVVGRQVIVSSSTEQFVYDIDLQSWTHHYYIGLSYPTKVNVVVNGVSVDRVCLGAVSGTAVGLESPTATNDAGTAITSSYRSGFWNPGAPMSESFVREWILDGSGTVNVDVAFNDAVAVSGSATSLALGSSISNGRRRVAARGRNFSFLLSAGSGAWSVSRVVAQVASQKGPGEKST